MDQMFLDRLLRWAEPEVVVELGTHCGLTAYFLAACMALRGGRTINIDYQDARLPAVREHWPANAMFIEANLLNQPVTGPGPSPRVIDILAHLPTRSVVLVDNGDKNREVAYYASHLPVGVTIAVHDWPHEAIPEKIIPHLEHDFEAIAHRTSAWLGSSFRAWRRWR